MEIESLSDHGVTILVRCRNYDDGSPKLKDIDVNTPHVWTNTCKPWDVVEITQRTTEGHLFHNGFNKN